MRPAIQAVTLDCRDWSYWTMPTALISLSRVCTRASAVATLAITRWAGETETWAIMADCCFCSAVCVPPAAGAVSTFLISSMPQMGQVPGLSLMMKGCMEQV